MSLLSIMTKECSPLFVGKKNCFSVATKWRQRSRGPQWLKDYC